MCAFVSQRVPVFVYAKKKRPILILVNQLQRRRVALAVLPVAVDCTVVGSTAPIPW